MGLEKIGRNISIERAGAPTPLDRIGALLPPAPVDPMDEALRIQERQSAASVRQSATQRMLQQSEIEKLEAEATRLELEERLAELQEAREARRAARSQNAGNDQLGFMAHMIEQAEARAERAEERAIRAEEARQRALDERLAAIETMRNAPAPREPTLVEQAEQLALVRKSLDGVFGDGKPPAVDPTAPLDAQMRMLKLQHEIEAENEKMRLRRVEAENARHAVDLEHSRESARSEHLANALPEVVDLTKRLIFQQRQDETAAEESASDPYVPATCPHCGNVVRVLPEWEGFICPECNQNSVAAAETEVVETTAVVANPPAETDGATADGETETVETAV